MKFPAKIGEAQTIYYSVPRSASGDRLNVGNANTSPRIRRSPSYSDPPRRGSFSLDRRNFPVSLTWVLGSYARALARPPELTSSAVEFLVKS
jgi:hypothetical protein